MDNPLYSIISESKRQQKSDDIVKLKANNCDVFFVVPANVVEEVRQFTWQCHFREQYKDYTVLTSKCIQSRQFILSLSQFLMGRVPEGYNVIDHIDRDRLN